MCVVTKAAGLAGRWAGRGSRLGRVRGVQQALGRAGRHAGGRAGSWGDRRVGSSGLASVSRRGRTRRRQAGKRQRARQVQQAWERGALGVGARGARRGRDCARRLGVLAGSVGLSWCTVHLAQL